MTSTLLQRTLDAYATLGRYSDTGAVSWLERDGWRRASTFTTSFARGQRLTLRVSRDGRGADVAFEADLSSSGPVSVTLYGEKKKRYPLQVALHACAGVTSAVSVLVPSLLLASAPGVDWFVGLFGGAPTTRSEVGRLVVSGRRGNEPECVAALDPERLLVRSLEWSLDHALRQRLQFDVTPS
ncbi:MAG: hypothetical protein KF878_14665 [Planctomycetes bacterium]|nr:hypothetical protein [Planctomycetota bacterium]